MAGETAIISIRRAAGGIVIFLALVGVAIDINDISFISMVWLSRERYECTYSADQWC